MCGSMVDIQSAAAEIRRGIKKKIDRKKPQGKNIMLACATQGGHNETVKMFYINAVDVWLQPQNMNNGTK